MKKLISVLLCFALMFTFLTMIASGADVSAAEEGNETILSIIVKLLQGVNWGTIITMIMETFKTLINMFS